MPPTAPIGDGGCGCGRSFSGMNSHRATTTAVVREVDLSYEDLRLAVAGFFIDGGCTPDLLGRGGLRRPRRPGRRGDGELRGALARGHRRGPATGLGEPTIASGRGGGPRRARRRVTRRRRGRRRRRAGSAAAAASPALRGAGSPVRRPPRAPASRPAGDGGPSARRCSPCRA
ncbi:DUF7715 family protein [Geodermatophilus sp. SYSU D00965]